jgi:RNA polymerase sigma-70 factor (ECF subfamily)
MNVEESAVMERYATGDDSAFAELYDLLAPRLHGYLLRRVRDPQLAEDLLQQTLLHVHRARASFIRGADVMPWLLAIARRLVIDHLRATRHELRRAGEEEAQRIAAPTARADDLVQAHQLALRIKGELARLPEPQRVAFDLYKLRGLSLAEAAEALHISVGALKLRLHRANQALRLALEE